MQIQNSLKYIGDFAGKFSLNALEGATLTSIVTLGPHLFKRYVHPGFTPLLDMPKAIAYTVMGALGYSAYKTILEPASTKLNQSITDIPKNISKFATDLIFPKAEKKESGDRKKIKDSVADIYGTRDNPTLRDKKIDDLSSSWFSARKDSKKGEKASLYSTTIWSLGTLSVFGGIFSVTSTWFDSPVVPFFASAAGALGGSYFLNKTVVYYGKKIADGAKESDLFKKTCEAVEKVWTFGGTSLKLAIFASGIWGANGLRENLVDPVINSKITNGSIEGASILWDWTSYVSGGVSSVVGAIATKVSPLYDFMFNSASECFKDPKTHDKMYEAIRSGAKNISEMDLPPHTPEECQRIFSNKEFIASYIKPVWDFGAGTANKVTSGVKFGFGLLGSGLYIANGLIFRGSTLEECADSLTNYKDNNPFLCTNAARIDSVFVNYLNPAGTAVKNGTLSTIKGLSSIFNKTWSVTMTGAGIVSGLLFRESTLKKCANEAGFEKANDFLCTNAGRIEGLFNGYLNPLGNNVKNSAIFIKDGFSSLFDKSWSATTASAGIISGLIYRQATLDKCLSDDDFKAANDFLCTNAGRVDVLFADYINPLASNIAEHATWAKDGVIHYGAIAATALGEAALNPTVQKGALGVVATGAALYGLHALATKVQQYYAPKDTFPMHDVEQGIPVAELVTSNEDNLPPKEMMKPSAPPAEFMQTDEDLNLDSIDLTPSAPPAEFMHTEQVLSPVQMDLSRDDAPVSFLSRVGSMFESFTVSVKAIVYSFYTSFTQFWNNFWTKKPIEKN